MKNVSELYSRKERPVKVLQIGEGNFLRAFVDYGIDVANEELGFNSNVAVIVPIANKPARFAKQNNNIQEYKKYRDFKVDEIVKAFNLDSEDAIVFYFEVRKIGNELLKIINHPTYGQVYEINEDF